MRRRAGAVSAVVALTGALLVMLAPPASAQGAYPPGDCSVTIGNQNVGNLGSGDTNVVIAPHCVFQINAPVTITVNNTIIGDVIADGSGVVVLPVSVLPSKALKVHGHHVPAVCGPNTLKGHGFSPVAGKHVTHTLTFNVVCPEVASTKVAFTGGNIIRWSLLALGAMLLGGLLVTSTRRHRRTGQTDDEPVTELTRS